MKNKATVLPQWAEKTKISKPGVLKIFTLLHFSCFFYFFYFASCEFGQLLLTCYLLPETFDRGAPRGGPGSENELGTRVGVAQGQGTCAGVTGTGTSKLPPPPFHLFQDR